MQPDLLSILLVSIAAAALGSVLLHAFLHTRRTERAERRHRDAEMRVLQEVRHLFPTAAGDIERLDLYYDRTFLTIRALWRAGEEAPGWMLRQLFIARDLRQRLLTETVEHESEVHATVNVGAPRLDTEYLKRGLQNMSEASKAFAKVWGVKP